MVVADLQLEGAVAEGAAALDAFSAADAQRLIEGVFVIGVFNPASARLPRWDRVGFPLRK